MMKYLFLATTILGTLSLTACSTLDEDVARYETMNCSQLSHEIGRYEEKLKSARVDSVVSGVIEVFGDKEESEDAEIDGILADMDIDEAEKYLAELQRIETQKGCR